MSISMPPVSWESLAAAHPSGIANAVLPRVKAIYGEIETNGRKLAGARLARETAVNDFAISEDPADIEVRENVAKLQAQIDALQTAITEATEARIELRLANLQSAPAEDNGVLAYFYDDAVSRFENFGKGASALLPELKSVKFPGSVEWITGEGALRAADSPAAQRLSAIVTYEGKDYDSISVASQQLKLKDNASMLTAQIMKQLAPREILPVGESITFDAIRQNGKTISLTVTGKATKRLGRPAKADSAEEVTTPAENVTAPTELPEEGPTVAEMTDGAETPVDPELEF